MTACSQFLSYCFKQCLTERFIGLVIFDIDWNIQKLQVGVVAEIGKSEKKPRKAGKGRYFLRKAGNKPPIPGPLFGNPSYLLLDYSQANYLIEHYHLHEVVHEECSSCS